MSALFWYNCLAAIGVGIAASTIYKKKHLTSVSTWLVFYLFATSLPWLGEFAVLGLFNSYAYKPGVFDNPWAENIVGHLILNSTLWPGVAMLVVGYGLRSGGISLITAAFLLVEYLFLRAGIWAPLVALLHDRGYVSYLFYDCKKWFPMMNKNRHGLSRFITLYLAAVVIIHLPLPLLLLYGKQYYHVAYAEDMYRSSTIFICFITWLKPGWSCTAFSLRNGFGSWYPTSGISPRRTNIPGQQKHPDHPGRLAPYLQSAYLYRPHDHLSPHGEVHPASGEAARIIDP